MKSQKFKCLRKLVWLCSILLLALSLLPNLIPEYWLIDIFSNFKLQYLAVSIFCFVMVIFLFQQKWPAMLVLLISIGWNSYYILPYYFSNKNETMEAEHQLKISSINLLSSNAEVNLVEKYIQQENPTVIVLMELTPQWETLLKDIIQNYPYHHLVPREDNFGIAVLSKHPLKAKTAYFGINQKPSIVSELNFNAKKLTIVATHPAAPVDEKAFELRNQQMNNLMESRLNFSDYLVVIGDFNNSSFSNHFQKLLEANLKDSRLGFGLLPTWPANFTPLQTTLDHCLVSKNINVIDRTVGQNVGSDHLPISVVIEF